MFDDVDGFQQKASTGGATFNSDQGGFGLGMKFCNSTGVFHVTANINTVRMILSILLGRSKRCPVHLHETVCATLLLITVCRKLDEC